MSDEFELPLEITEPLDKLVKKFEGDFVGHIVNRILEKANERVLVVS